MLFGYGPGEILLCIVPIFLVIFVIGISLMLNNRKTGSDKEQK